MIRQDLTTYQKHFRDYTELRIQENRNQRITLVNGNLMANARAAKSGISARVYRNGSWGFACHPQNTDEAIQQCIAAATDNARFLDLRKQGEPRPLPTQIGKVVKDFSTKKERVPQKDMIAFAQEADDYIKKQYPWVTSRTVVFSGLDMEKHLITSDGADAFTMIPRTMFVVVLAAEKDGEAVDLYDLHGGFGHYEDIDWSKDTVYPMIDNLAKRLSDKREGIFARSGTAECILDADLAGILAHEAIGHTTEADFVLGGSIAGEYLNQEVASPLITLVDYAHTAHGAICPVPVFVDDEGTEARDAVIIDQGMLRTYLHNKDTAAHFDVAPTGNARAFQFSDEPLIRMRNTAFVPGTSKREDMIASVEEGYYLVRSGNGQADSTSEFMFGITLGYEIKNGKIGKALKDCTISGTAFDVLKTVSMVSDEMKWSNGGMCGKKQPIPVGMGGPAIK